MRLSHAPRLLWILALVFISAGCERPALRVAESEEKPQEREAEPLPVVDKNTELQEPEAPEPPEIQTFADPVEPSLLVIKIDGEIVISGEIKSKSHQERIGEQLSAALSPTKVVNNLKVNFDCYAVPWTGRVTEEFLIPYFREVRDPVVEYKNGTVVLKGSVGQSGKIKSLTEMGINAFSSAFSKAVDNQLRVAE